MSIRRMKGGGATNSTVSQTTTDLPEWVKPYQEAILERASLQSSMPYETYDGPRIADMSPWQQEASARMVEMAQTGPNQGLTEASRLAYNVGNDSFGDVNTNIWSGYSADPLNGRGDYAAGRMNDPAAMQSYMNPYQQNVVDVEKREAARQADIRHQATGLDAAKSGSLGGYREGIMRSETERNLGQNMADIQTRGSQSAYQNAQQAYEQDRAARQFQAQNEQNQYSLYENAKQQEGAMGLTAQQANQQAQLGLQQNQMGYQQNQLQAGQQLAGYGQQGWQDQMDKLGILQGVGEAQQQQYQKQLDTSYNDFMRQQAFPWEQIGLYNNIIHGGAIQPGTYSQAYGPQASTGQQALGGGIAAAGLMQGKGG